MAFERAEEVLRENGLEWEVRKIVSKEPYHFIQCLFNGKRYTVVYNDKMDKIVNMTMEA